MGRVKLHIGCGNRTLPGYINVDIQDFPGVDRVDNARTLHSFKDEEGDEIYCSHLLNHFNRSSILDVLSCWNQVLKPGGRIRIAVPDFEAICKVYAKDGLSELEGLLCGGQRHELDHHTMQFDFALLQSFLEAAGFGDVCRYDWQGFLPMGFDDCSMAYIPHMNEEHGTLMSLNVTAVKKRAPMTGRLPLDLRKAQGEWRGYDDSQSS